MTTTKQEPTAPLARVCSWHNGFMSPEDRRLAEAGAMVTHSCCVDCLRIHFPELSEVAERILASFDDVSQRTEVIREGDRCCLQCFGPIAGAKPWPAPAPAWCPACEAARK